MHDQANEKNLYAKYDSTMKFPAPCNPSPIKCWVVADTLSGV